MLLLTQQAPFGGAREALLVARTALVVGTTSAALKPCFSAGTTTMAVFRAPSAKVRLSVRTGSSGQHSSTEWSQEHRHSGTAWSGHGHRGSIVITAPHHGHGHSRGALVLVQLALLVPLYY